MIDAEPGSPTPPPESPSTWGGPLWRALPLGLGSFASGYAALLALSLLVAAGVAWQAHGNLEPPRDPDSEQRFAASERRLEAAATMLVISLPVLAGFAVLSCGVSRGRRWARGSTAAVGCLTAVAQAVAANRGEEPSWTAAGLGLSCLLLLATRLDPWFDPAERERLHGPQNTPYAAAHGWLGAWTAVILTLGLSFREIFRSMGVELGWASRLIVDLADSAEAHAVLVVPLLVAIPLLLLRLGPARAQSATLGLHAVGALGLLAFGYGLVWPIVALQRALGQ